MFTEEFDKLSQSPFLVGAQMVMDVPAQVVLAKIEIVFGSGANDGVERIEAKIFSFAKLPA